MQLNIKTIVVGDLEENCYIIEKNNKCIVIDPGDEFEKIDSNITCKLIAILITHHHFDHIGALEELKNKYNVEVYDSNNLNEGNINIEDFNIEVIFTKGHTNDSITYYFKDDNVMFTGDFLFKEDIGRTDLPTGNMFEMKKSIEKIKKYPDKIIVYPGHDESTNLEYEKQQNIYFK